MENNKNMNDEEIQKQKQEEEDLEDEELEQQEEEVVKEEEQEVIEEELYNKNIKELTEEEIDILFDNDKIEFDKLLEALKSKEDKSVKDFIADATKPAEKGEEKSDADSKVIDQIDEGKTDSGRLITIDDAYIQKTLADLSKDNPQSAEQLKSILEGVKGESFTSKALQNYINSQLYIKEIKSPLNKDWQMPEESKTEEYIKQAEEIKKKTLISKMKEHFPDYPDDLDEDNIALFEESLSRRDYSRYLQLIDEEKEKIDREFDRYFYIANNWEQLAIDTIKSDLQLFEKKLSESGVKLSDLGIDLQLDENGYNKFLFDNILLPNNKVNNKIVHFIGESIPVLEPRALYKELLDLFYNDILELALNKGKSTGYKEAIKDIPEPKGTHGSKSAMLDYDEEVNIFDSEDVDDELLDKHLNKIRKKILNNR